MLANGHREVVDGRSVLFYDIVPNPKFEAKNLNQHLAQVMQGKVSIDEQTGELIDINVTSVADLKIGGGLVANVHKGLWLHIHNQPRPDGVWLTDLAEGSGDARAAFFLHPYFRFKETSDSVPSLHGDGQPGGSGAGGQAAARNQTAVGRLATLALRRNRRAIATPEQAAENYIEHGDKDEIQDGREQHAADNRCPH